MSTAQNDNGNSLRSGQEPHQREEMDQAEAASKASFSLEPEKGITPDPDDYNKGATQGNIKQIDSSEDIERAPTGTQEFDTVSDTDLNEDENAVTPDDLQALGGKEEDDTTSI